MYIQVVRVDTIYEAGISTVDSVDYGVAPIANVSNDDIVEKLNQLIDSRTSTDNVGTRHWCLLVCKKTTIRASASWDVIQWNSQCNLSVVALLYVHVAAILLQVHRRHRKQLQ